MGFRGGPGTIPVPHCLVPVAQASVSWSTATSDLARATCGSWSATCPTAWDGKQRYRCRSCAYTFREDPQPNGYPEEEKVRILAAYQERTSLRGLTRIFGVSRNTVSAWLKERAEALPPLEETLTLAEAERVIGSFRKQSR